MRRLRQVPELRTRTVKHMSRLRTPTNDQQVQIRVRFASDERPLPRSEVDGGSNRRPSKPASRRSASRWLPASSDEETWFPMAWMDLLRVHPFIPRRSLTVKLQNLLEMAQPPRRSSNPFRAPAWMRKGWRKSCKTAFLGSQIPKSCPDPAFSFSFL
jgi:hypothetical protein